MSDEQKRTRKIKVEPGQTLADVAAHHRVKPEVIVQHNEKQLRHDAEARGFEHGFQRRVPKDSGGYDTVVDYHVFAGQEFEVPDDEDEEFEVPDDEDEEANETDEDQSED